MHEGGQNGKDGRTPGSNKAFIWLIVLGIGAGVLLLGALGVYGFLEYFGTDDTAIELPGSDESLLVIETSEAIATPPAGELSTADPVAAIATDACGSFLSQFPGTPCPSERIPGVEATATVACKEFLSQFPGTPCP